MYYLGRMAIAPSAGEWTVTPAQQRSACMRAGDIWFQMASEQGVCIPKQIPFPGSEVRGSVTDVPEESLFRCEHVGINWCVVGGAIVALFLVSTLMGRR